uniref:Tyrosinase copper-binding domain-containing protein n=1 Tax=Acrobeloides nanus TaxID=290746 RepID=A0A914C628_9BILA
MWRKLIRRVLLWVLVGIVYGQFNFREDCSDAPTEELRQICLRLRQMDRNARAAFERQVDFSVFPPAMPGAPVWQQPLDVPWNSRGQIATNPHDCMTLACLCPFFSGTIQQGGVCILQNGAPLAMGYRKEYRMMTDDERNRFHNALQTMKMRGEYDRFSFEHRATADGSGAHSGPGFLPWHREYTKRFEIALRLIDPSVAIPYWDSVMDGYLPDPRDSIMWSNDFMGESDWNGNVIGGPFAFWRTIEGRPTILRVLGQSGNLFTENQVNMVLAQTNVEYVLTYSVPSAGCPYPINYNAIEYFHSYVHFWLGGDMFQPLTSANDPIFYVHHSFIDLIWENWRLLRQPKWVRESAYPPDLPQCASPFHFSYAQLAPYNLILRDGLSNSYTDQLYRYAPRPTCSYEMPTCGSRWLFCDTRGYPHCVAKIKLGGLCQGFEGFDACFMGQCIFGRCVPGPTPPPWRPTTLSPPPTPQPTPPPTTTPMPNNIAPRPQFVDC